MSDYTLSKGAHDSPADGRCAMEWVAYIAGEPHSDHPVCVDAPLREFAVAWNDALDDDTRQKLRPYLARMIGTAGDGRSRERSFMCLDWLVRTHTPAWFDLAGLMAEGAALRALGPIVDDETARASAPVVRAAQEKASAAWAAAGAAARAAARDAAVAAAGDAVRDAAWDAAWAAARAAAGAAAVAAAWDAAWAAARAAAGDAVRAAAGDAAGDAARDAARDAAWDALAATVKELQASAFELLERMLPTVTVDMPTPVAERAREVCEAT